MDYHIVNDNVLRWAEQYDGPPFHAILCDPPYNLDSIKKRFGKQGSAAAQYGDDGAFQRVSRGFMNKEWDDDVAFSSETWKAICQHLYPGAFVMAFAGSRTVHRLMCAMEDSGLIIHPTIGWLTAQGLPKATRVDAQIESEEGATIWKGHRYGLQALKPSLEFIVVAQKPYDGRPIDNITETGAGALNIDAARIQQSSSTDHDQSRDGEASVSERYVSTGATNFAVTPGPRGGSAMGRWPSNFALCHTPECVRVGTERVAGTGTAVRHRGVAGGTIGPPGNKAPGTPDMSDADADGLETVAAWDCAPGCPCLSLNDMAGHDRPVGKVTQSHVVNEGGECHVNYGIYGKFAAQRFETYGDTGPTSRFYYNAGWAHEIAEAIDGAPPVFFEGKAALREREAGLATLPDQKFAQSNSALSAIKQGKDKCDKEPLGLNVIKRRKNVHPTVKPIALCQWLATLLLPPDEYAERRILVPFAGVMSEAIGCMLAGWDMVVTVELEEEYAQIGEARMKWWKRMARRRGPDVAAILARSAVPDRKKKKDNPQLSLF